MLDRAAEACGGYRIDHPEPRESSSSATRRTTSTSPSTRRRPGGSERTAIVDGEPAVVRSTAQIISGKLSGRGKHGPARDLVDIAACGAAEPEALEIAVNALPEKSLDAILSIYAETAKQYAAADASELEGIAQGRRPVVDDPAGYASNDHPNRAGAPAARENASATDTMASQPGGRRSGRASRAGRQAVGQPVQKEAWRLIWICPLEPPGTVWIM